MKLSAYTYDGKACQEVTQGRKDTFAFAYVGRGDQVREVPSAAQDSSVHIMIGDVLNHHLYIVGTTETLQELADRLTEILDARAVAAR